MSQTKSLIKLYNNWDMLSIHTIAKATRLSLLVSAVLLLAACGGESAEDHLAQASQLEKNGDYAGALQSLKGALRQDPDNARTRARFSQMYLLLGKPADARTQLDRARRLGIDESAVVLLDIDIALAEGEAELALDKIDGLRQENRSTETELRQAQAHLLLGQSDKAQAIFKTLIEHSDDIEPRLGFVRGAIAEGDSELALRSINEAQAIHGKSAELWMLKGSVYLERENFDAARTALLEGKKHMSVQQDPTTVVLILQQLSQAQLSLGEFGDARVNINALRELQPNDVQTWLLLATVNVAQKRYDEALDIERAILAAEPRNVAALMLAARTNYADGNLYQAETQLKRLLDITPENLEAGLMLSDILVNQGDALQALDVLEGLQQLHPKSADLLVRVGHARLSNGQPLVAIENFQKALHLEPAHTAASLQLVSALLQTGDQAAAREILSLVQVNNDADSAARSQLMLLAHTNAGDAAGATQNVNELLKMHPDDANLHRVAAGYLISQGAFDAAKAAIDRATELAPATVANSLLSAGLLIATNNVEQAREELLAVLKRVPEHAVAMTALAKIDLGAGKKDEAIRWLERARSSSRDDTEARFMLANLYLDDDKTIRAQTVLGELLELHPNNVSVKRRAAELYRQMGKISKARKLLQSAVKNAGENVPELRALAASMARLGFNKDARAALAKAEKLSPAPELLAGDSAALSLASGELDQAASQIETIRKLSPKDVDALLLDARLQAANGRYEQAADLLGKAVEYGAGSQAVVLRYQMLRQANDESAVRILEQHLNNQAEDLPVLLAMAQHEQSHDRLAAAQGFYERALSEEPAHPVALNNLAWIYLSRGDARALPTARKAYQSAPGNASVADTLGWTLLKLGHSDESLEYLRQADQLSKGDGEIRFHLAAALKKAGKLNEAQQLLERLLASNAPFAGRREAVQMLRKLQSETGSLRG